MRVISAYLLAVLGGNSSPKKSDIESILSSVGIEAESDRIEALFSELEGKDISEVVAQGLSKLASVPSGGGGGVAAPSGGGGGGGAAAGGGAAEAKEEAKKEEPEEEEEDEDMGFSLFD